MYIFGGCKETRTNTRQRLTIHENNRTGGEGAGSAKGMVQTTLSEKNFKKIKISKIEKKKIWIFVIFVLFLHCVFHGIRLF